MKDIDKVQQAYEADIQRLEEQRKKMAKLLEELTDDWSKLRVRTMIARLDAAILTLQVELNDLIARKRS